MKLKGLFILFLLLTGLTSRIVAKKIEQSDAQMVAVTYMAERIKLFSTNQDFNLEVNNVVIRHYEDLPVYYAVNFAEGGFVIVAADDILTPVIGYAFQGSYTTEGHPEAFAGFISNRAEEAATCIRMNLEPTVQTAKEWISLKSGKVRNFDTEAITDVDPLIMPLWNQDYPYNALCPSDPDGPGGYVYAGCVATAMSMIMYYYRYPDVGQGSKTHYSSYGPLYANFGQTYYQWDAMLNSVGTASGNSIAAVAELQYHCGIAVNMQYGPGGSGAYSNTVPSAAYNYFRYNSQINYTARNSYSYTNWVNMLKSQIDSGYPLYYSGQSSDGGHAFVCDGYQEDGSNTTFHFNWGWGGSYNGYYHLDNLNPGNDPPFSGSQAVVRNFYPPSANYPLYNNGETKVIPYTRGTLEDGSGPIHNYLNNVNYSWLIAPTDSVTSITLNFLKFNTQANDIVTVYNGDDDNAPVLGSFSGTTLPASVTVTGDRMFIKFLTDANGNAPGWFAEYTCTLPVYCSGLTTVLDPHGEFSDGSGEFNYNNNSFCRWYIKPPDADSVTLSFTSLNTESDKDYIQILRIPGNQVLGQFSGNTIPPAVTSNTGEMMVIFRSNNFYNAQGWEAVWTIGGNQVMHGDANCDGVVNVLDLVAMISYILAQNPSPFCPDNADINSDGVINVLDVVGTVNIILSGKKTATLPVNSKSARIFLNHDGIALQSDGTISGLQFEIQGLQSGELHLVLSGYEFASAIVDGKLTGIVYSLNNEPFPSGKIRLFSLTNHAEGLSWGDVIASNYNAAEVKVEKFEYAPAIIAEDYVLKAYPNPSQGRFFVEIGIPCLSETIIRITDISGKEVWKLQENGLQEGTYQFELNTGKNLEAGNYLLHLFATPDRHPGNAISKNMKLIISE